MKQSIEISSKDEYLAYYGLSHSLRDVPIFSEEKIQKRKDLKLHIKNILKTKQEDTNFSLICSIVNSLLEDSILRNWYTQKVQRALDTAVNTYPDITLFAKKLDALAVDDLVPGKWRFSKKIVDSTSITIESIFDQVYSKDDLKEIFENE